MVRSVGHQGAGLECLSRVGAERQYAVKREPCDESPRLKRQAFLVDRDEVLGNPALAIASNAGSSPSGEWASNI